MDSFFKHTFVVEVWIDFGKECVPALYTIWTSTSKILFFKCMYMQEASPFEKFSFHCRPDVNTSNCLLSSLRHYLSLASTIKFRTLLYEVDLWPAFPPNSKAPNDQWKKHE